MKADIGNSAGRGGHPCRAAGALQLRFGFPGVVGSSAEHFCRMRFQSAAGLWLSV
jgi:hypothetical protein